MPSGSASGSAAAGTTTPESSASQPITGISHAAARTGRISGSAACASGTVFSPNHEGRHSMSPVTTTTTGTSGLYAPGASEPMLAWIFRSSTAPAPPRLCSTSPANAPRSDRPVTGKK
jgi:hypothetical protein